MNLVRLLLIPVWVACLSGFLQAQGQEGDYFIHNFLPEEYKGSPQIFMSAEDEQGLVYFAGNEGVLIYDGVKWKLVTLPNRSRINHIACLRPGRVFISATAEFGELVSGPLGDIRYHSYLPRIPKADRNFQEIVHCYAQADHRFFITRDKIFCLGDNSCTVIPVIPYGGLQFGENLFIIQKDKPGFFSLLPDGLREVPGSASLGEIRALLQYSEKEILISSSNGPHLFTPGESLQSKARFKPAGGGIIDLLEDPESYYAYRLKDTLFALGGDKNPLRFYDHNGRLLNFMSQSNGLLSNEIHHLRLDHFDNLWISQNRGISYVQISSPLTRFATDRGLDGLTLAAITHQGTVYASTFFGLHYKTPTMGSFAHIEGTASPCFSFFVDRHKRLFASDGNRLVQITGNQIREVFKATGFIYTIAETPLRPDLFFLGLDSGLISIRLKSEPARSQSAVLHQAYEGLSHAVRVILCDSNGDLWLSLEYQGLWKLTLSEQIDSLPGRIDRVNTPPFDHAEDAYIVSCQDRLYTSSSKGVFLIEELNGPPFVLTPVQLPGTPDPNHEKRILTDPSGTSLWLYGNQQLLRYRQHGNQGFIEERTPFSKIDSASIESIFTAEDGCSWICTNNGLYRYDPTKDKKYQQNFFTRIRHVTTTKGRPLLLDLGSTLPPAGGISSSPSREGTLILPYTDHSLRFEYSSLFYEHSHRNQYQTILEGFDSHWSDWTANDHKEYTNLPHGDFTFKVRSRNIFGTIGSTDSFSFSIQTPWFLSLWAFSLYLVLAFFLLRLILFLYTRRLEKQKMILEKAVKERTWEVEEQKRQIAEKNRILNDLATTDDLTGIANHRKIMEYFRSEWHRALREKMPLAVLLADVDNFKAYNDHFGHLQGDQCLKKVAEAFEACALRPADMAGRYGGEEFLMILPQTSAAGAITVAENVCQAVRDLNIQQKEGGDSEIVTISIGAVSVIPRGEMNPQLLLILADQALYRSKGTGKNRVTMAEQYTES